MAEFALVLTPCLTLFFGIINFALALYCYDFVCYSAQQAVRYATVHGSTAVTPATMQTTATMMKTKASVPVTPAPSPSPLSG